MSETRSERFAFTSGDDRLTGVLYLPPGQPVAVAVTTGPLTSVKEQATGAYVERGGELGASALVAPDDDDFVEQFERALVVAEAGLETTGESHDAARSKGQRRRTCGRGRGNARPRRSRRRDRRYLWGEVRVDP